MSESKYHRPSFRTILGLPDNYRVKRYRHEVGYDLAHIECTDEPNRVCPRCGARGQKNGFGWRKIWHTPVRGVPLMLMVKTARMRCPKCRKTWREQHAFVGDASIHMSEAVQECVKLDIMSKMAFTAIAEKEGPSPHMVSMVMDSVMEEYIYLPETLCIDEFKANTNEGKMAVAISDANYGTIIEILPKLNEACVGGWFAEFRPMERRKVRFYCCDMSPLFVGLHEKWFPDATLCIDKFHVVKRVNTAFKDVRLRKQRDTEAFDEKTRKEMRKYWKLFMMRPEDVDRLDYDYVEEQHIKRLTIMSTLDLTDEEYQELQPKKPREARASILCRLLDSDEELRRAYGLMQLFRNWSDMKWCAEKRDGLSQWITMARLSGIPEMEAAAKTLKEHREGILNGYRHNKTNATAEGLNNSIKVMKRMSYGFKDFATMRRRIKFSLGYFRIINRGLRLNEIRNNL